MPGNKQLTDGPIRIRPLELTDSDAMYRAVRESIPQLSRWLSWAKPDFTRQESKAYIRTRVSAWSLGTTYAFAVTHFDDGTFLGSCSISHIHHAYRFANLGYWIRSSQTSNGYATTAARLAACFAFEQLNLIRMEIVVAVGNEASLRVAEKTGARREGTLRNRIIIHDDIYDAVMYSLIPADLR